MKNKFKDYGRKSLYSWILKLFGYNSEQELDFKEDWSESKLQTVIYPKLTTEQKKEYYLRIKNGESIENIRLELLAKAKVINYE